VAQLELELSETKAADAIERNRLKQLLQATQAERASLEDKPVVAFWRMHATNPTPFQRAGACMRVCVRATLAIRVAKPLCASPSKCKVTVARSSPSAGVMCNDQSLVSGNGFEALELPF
jgi:hypothetical protein